MLSWHVVEAPIPLLWGKESMKKAEVLLDLPNDRARVKGLWIDLVVSDCDHYGLNMLPKSKSMVTFEGLVAKEDSDKIEVHKDEGEDKVGRRSQTNLGRNRKMLPEDENKLLQGDRKKWSGSATVIGKHGNVYYLSHQSSLLRVSPQRMIGIEEAEKMKHEGDGGDVEEKEDEPFFKNKEDHMQFECKQLPDSEEDAGGFEEEMGGDVENIAVDNADDDVIEEVEDNESDTRQQEEVDNEEEQRDVQLQGTDNESDTRQEEEVDDEEEQGDEVTVEEDKRKEGAGKMYRNAVKNMMKN